MVRRPGTWGETMREETEPVVRGLTWPEVEEINKGCRRIRSIAGLMLGDPCTPIDVGTIGEIIDELIVEIHTMVNKGADVGGEDAPTRASSVKKRHA